MTSVEIVTVMHQHDVARLYTPQHAIGDCLCVAAHGVPAVQRPRNDREIALVRHACQGRTLESHGRTIQRLASVAGQLLNDASVALQVARVLARRIEVLPVGVSP